MRDTDPIHSCTAFEILDLSYLIMSFVQLESLDGFQKRNSYAKYRKYVALTVVLVGTTLLGMAFVKGLFHYDVLSIDPPMPTSLSVRPDYPVSAFLDERGLFKWFIGVLPALIGVGLAFAGIGPACVVATGGVVIAGCVLAAVGAAYTVVSSLQAASTTRKLEIAQQTMVYMGYQDMSAKRSVDFAAMGLMDPIEAQQFLDDTFGSPYRFHSVITEADEHNRHLVERNNGNHIPVFTWTTPDGTNFHHAMIRHEESGTAFHRFGFHGGDNTTITKRHGASVATISESFKSEGIDILGCTADDPNHIPLNNNDQKQMQQEIQCAVPNFSKAGELAVQVFDQTTMETIAAGRVAPFNTKGSSVITESQYSSCPTGLTNDGKNCPVESTSD